jgi:hypothetical protein
MAIDPRLFHAGSGQARHPCGYMADIRIGVRVSFKGRDLRVVGISSKDTGSSCVLLEDEDTGERFVVTTRVVDSRQVARG